MRVSVKKLNSAVRGESMKHLPNTELKVLLQLIDEAYDKHAWHGTNLRGSIRGLTLKQAIWRPSPERYNIREIIVHTAYWKYIIRRRLLGEKKVSFPSKGSNWFVRPKESTEASLREDIYLLDEMHRKMRKAIASFNPSQLWRASTNSKYTDISVISGIACHDIYHAGQIQLLKRLMKQ
jgi:uncharacterized damage-inducible protein DinB